MILPHCPRCTMTMVPKLAKANGQTVKWWECQRCNVKSPDYGEEPITEAIAWAREERRKWCERVK